MDIRHNLTRMNIDIEKTIVNNAQNKDWQIEYHHNVLNLPINNGNLI